MIFNQFFNAFALLFFCSCKNKAIENLPPNDFETFSDTISLVFQEFHNQTIISEFDTVNIIILHELNKTTITRDFDLANNSNQTIIHKNGNQYSIEKESAEAKCGINNVEYEFENLGNLLVGSCWLESNGLPYSDSGGKVIYSTEYGELLFKAYQTNSGQVIYSIDGINIPVSIRLELIDK